MMTPSSRLMKMVGHLLSFVLDFSYFVMYLKVVTVFVLVDVNSSRSCSQSVFESFSI